jgi:hypothetical protein
MSVSIDGAKGIVFNESPCPEEKPRGDTGVALDSGPGFEKKASEAASLGPICDMSKPG